MVKLWFYQGKITVTECRVQFYVLNPQAYGERLRMQLLSRTWGCVLTFMALMLFTLVTAYADEPCGGEMEIPVYSLESSLQTLLPKVTETGKFKVSEKLDENGSPFQHTITYEVNNNVIYKKNINRTLLGEPGNYGAYFDIKPLAQGKALYFEIFTGGTNPNLNCSYIFSPQSNKVTKISLNQLGYWTYTEDLDKDGDLEIIAGKLPAWYSNCGDQLSGASTPYWYEIKNVDLPAGQLRDDSARYPNFYVDLANGLKDKLKEVRETPSSTSLSTCISGIQDLINRADKMGNAKPSALASNKNPQDFVSLNIKAMPPIKERQDWKSFLGNKSLWQLEEELVLVAGDRLMSVGNNECYNGTMDALAYNQGYKIFEDSIDALAKSIIEKANGSISTGTIAGDFILRFAVNFVTTAALTNDSLIENSAIFIAEQASGYMAAYAVRSYMAESAGALSFKLTYPVVKDMLIKDDIYSWDFSGSNENARYYRQGVVPLTRINVKAIYNPFTHYTTAIIFSSCQDENNAINKVYIMSYEVNKNSSGAAEIISDSYVESSRIIN